MDGALRAKGSIDAALGPLELARGPRDEARMCAVVASPLEGGRDNSSDCSSVVACEPIDPDPRPSPLCEFKDCRRLRFDLVEPAVGGRSRGTAWTNCREVGTGDGRELGPSFANPSATGLSMSPRFGLASRLRKERIGDVVTFRPTGLEILLSGSGMAAASAVARGGGIESIRLFLNAPHHAIDPNHTLAVCTQICTTISAFSVGTFTSSTFLLRKSLLPLQPSRPPLSLPKHHPVC